MRILAMGLAGMTMAYLGACAVNEEVQDEPYHYEPTPTVSSSSIDDVTPTPTPSSSSQSVTPQNPVIVPVGNDKKYTVVDEPVYIVRKYQDKNDRYKYIKDTVEVTKALRLEGDTYPAPRVFVPTAYGDTIHVITDINVKEPCNDLPFTLLDIKPYTEIPDTYSVGILIPAKKDCSGIEQ
jgi:hypothetical protein